MSRSNRIATTIFIILALSTASVAETPPVTVTTLAPELDGGVGGVAVDRVGFVYVADFGEKVWKIDPFGKVEVFADTMYGASGNAIDLEGNLLQANFYGNFIAKIARDGTVTRFASGLTGPVGITVAPDGTAYVCNCRSNSIAKITTTGTVSQFSSGNLFACPNGITIDANGDLYVVNFSDGRMIKIDQKGEASLFATIPGFGNGHIAAVTGEFYVTSFRGNALYRVTADGTVTRAAGNGQFADEDGVGTESKLASPNGITYDATRDVLYTNDYLTPLAVRFQRSTPPKSSVRKIAFPSFQAIANAAFADGGPEAAKDAMREYRTTRPGRMIEPVLNGFAYQFLQSDNVQNAIAMFELGTEFFPQSFNTWDSLGEGHKTAGNKSKAIEFYRKSLELNPANTNATAMLEELGAE